MKCRWLLPPLLLTLLATPAQAITYLRTFAPAVDLTRHEPVLVLPFQTSFAGLADGRRVSQRLVKAIEAEGFLEVIDGTASEHPRDVDADGERLAQAGREQGAGSVLVGTVLANFSVDYGSTPVYKEFIVYRTEYDANGHPHRVE
ncbi:MAG TPA: hypothetical protein VEI97_16520, partial [bacterium]|nr:hypothetical protein [bacterium]